MEDTKQAPTVSETITMTELLAKLNEVLELSQNIDAKVDRFLQNPPASSSKKESASSSASTTSSGGCKYVKQVGRNNGQLCGKRVKDGTDYCADHPEGMTKAQYQKKVGDSAPTETSTRSRSAKTEKLEDNDDYSKITSPAALLGVVVTTSKPHQAICKFEDENSKKVKKLSNQEKELLAKLKISAMADKEAKDIIEELEFELEPETKKESKTDPKKTKKVSKKKDSSDEEEEASEEEEEEERASKASKVKSLLNKNAKAKATVSLKKTKKEESEDDDEDEDDE